MTSTWYTEPLQFNNLQVPDAFTIPFTKSMPGQFNHLGEQYAGVQFYYLVFPYKAGSFKIPSMEIVATTPPEGSSVSRKVTVHTPPQSYIVKPIPREFPAGEDWLVAKNVTVRETWNRPFDSLKVGDVLERKLVIDAMGTVPQFIPATRAAKEPWANIYPQAAQLKDTRDENDANGERVERSTYLLLQSGDYELPVTTVYWWNPFTQQLHKHSTPARKVHVRDNPDLGMLTTLKDSLAAAAQPAAAKKKLLMIGGLPWYWALLCGIAGFAVLWALTATGIRFWRRARKVYLAYQQSERYWFMKFMRVKPASAAFLQALYGWWDRLSFPRKLPAVLPSIVGEQELEKDLAAYTGKLYGQQQADPAIAQMLQQQLKHFRKKVLRMEEKDTRLPEAQRPWQ
jgi:hypothetical protein